MCYIITYIFKQTKQKTNKQKYSHFTREIMIIFIWIIVLSDQLSVCC